MKKITLTIIIFLILIISIIMFPKEKEEIKIIKKEKTSSFISMMVENENGEYIEKTNLKFPSENYIFNPQKSGCENGGTLSWNSEKQKIEASLLTSDKCYAYFDVYTPEKYCQYNEENSLVCDILRNKDNTLIYHDGLCDYEGEENCTLEAEDFSYRFSGASDIVSNYVCLDSLDAGDCESDEDLYRIIGLFKNEQNQYEIKLIKAQGATTTELGDDKVEGGAYYGKYDYIESYYKGNNYKNLSSYYWNNSNGESSTNMWKYSNLNKVNLNNFYYNYLIKKIPYLEKHLVNYAYNVGGVVSYENVKEVFYNELGAGKITKNDNNCYSESNTNFRICNEENDLIYSAKIGLMYMSDYMYGTLSKYWKTTVMNYSQDLIKESNWLYVGLYEWTISRMVNPNSARRVGFTGVADSMEINSHGAVRPVFYITSDAKIKEGEGTKEKPYRITFD